MECLNKFIRCGATTTSQPNGKMLAKEKSDSGKHWHIISQTSSAAEGRRSMHMLTLDERDYVLYAHT